MVVSQLSALKLEPLASRHAFRRSGRRRGAKGRGGPSSSGRSSRARCVDVLKLLHLSTTSSFASMASSKGASHE